MLAFRLARGEEKSRITIGLVMRKMGYTLLPEQALKVREPYADPLIVAQRTAQDETLVQPWASTRREWHGGQSGDLRDGVQHCTVRLPQQLSDAW